MKVTVFILEQKLNKLVSGDSFGPIRTQKCDQEVDQGQEKLSRSRDIPPPQVNTASRQAAEVKGHHRNPINGKRGGKRWMTNPAPNSQPDRFLSPDWFMAAGSILHLSISLPSFICPLCLLISLLSSISPFSLSLLHLSPISSIHILSLSLRRRY